MWTCFFIALSTSQSVALIPVSFEYLIPKHIKKVHYNCNFLLFFLLNSIKYTYVGFVCHRKRILKLIKLLARKHQYDWDKFNSIRAN